jgi:hypothetical protein
VLAHEQVIELLAEAATRGRRVVRLKGGDPVVFGRGGEEALELAARGIATELVPGISSAVAAPELAGIPLTHRGVAAGFLVVTGRCATEDRVDWEQAARFRGTLVVLMGATRLGAICLELRRFGRSASTPGASSGQGLQPISAEVSSPLRAESSTRSSGPVLSSRSTATFRSISRRASRRHSREQSGFVPETVSSQTAQRTAVALGRFFGWSMAIWGRAFGRRSRQAPSFLTT